MKIYETEDDGKIGDLLYKTVEFTRQELVAGGVGVISQGAVLRYLKAAKPDLKIKKCGSFKLDSQEDTVTMRIGIADTKLLNPGYDELKDSYDRTKKRYDALVEAVSKDSQKFSAMLVENEELKTKLETADETYEGLRATHAELLRKLESDKLNGFLAEQEIDFSPEDAADLTSDDENKDTVDLEPEGEPDDGTPDCRSDGTVPLSETERQDIVPTKEITQEEAKKIMEENEKYPGQYQV